MREVVMIDECLTSGFLGETGRGTPELCGVQGRIGIISNTLGKALGGATGGYTTGHKLFNYYVKNQDLIFPTQLHLL